MSPRKTVRKQGPVKKVAKGNSRNLSVIKQLKQTQLKSPRKKPKVQVEQKKKSAQETELPVAPKKNPKLIHRQHPFTSVVQLFACGDVARLAETKKDSLGRASKRYMVEAARELKELGLL